MKKMLFVLALLTLGLGVSLAQEFKVDYKIQYKYTHHSNLAAIEHDEAESLYLFIGENQSVFTNYNVAHEEEINKKMEEMMSLGFYDPAKWGEKHSNFNTQIYKNHVVKEVWILPALEKYSLAYSEPRVPLKWTILEQESKEFMGFSVQAATADFAGRSYTAWFTTEISIPDGPHVFYGLPGLVMDVYDSEKHFRFQLEGIDKPETLRKLPKHKKIDRSEFDKIHFNHTKMNEQRTLELVLSGAVQAEAVNGSGVVTLTKDKYLFEKRKKEQEHKKNHNPMELE